jgi:tetratricopeptide (TPR) repeat protein
MNLRPIATIVVLCALNVAVAVHAENLAPRDIWPQATAAATSGDVAMAITKTNELMTTGKSYGVNGYPLYAAAAAALARQASHEGKKDVADWASKAADQLDATSPAVAFSKADRAREAGDWARAIPAAFTGMMRVFVNYRTRMLARADLMFALVLAIAAAAVFFAIALFIRYGRSMAHDFREMLARRIHGGSVSVLGFALLFLPLFLWLSPVWLVLYWLVIFFGYANKVERTLIVVLALAIATLPVAVDFTAAQVAMVDSPVVMSALATREQRFQPEALRRMQDLAALVPDNATIQLLLGNLQLQEGNEPQAAVHYNRAIQLRDSAGAHVNLGNLHFLDNDFAAAITEYERAEQLDPKLAIAFYNNSVASGEMYKFDEQGQKLEMAKRLDRSGIEKYAQSPPAQKIVIYNPPLEEAWSVQHAISKRGIARAVFGNYAWFDMQQSALNPLTLGAAASVLFAIALWFKRRKAGYAGACIKCGRTFCHRCKSARESATYCTQCIHIYLKRDGVSLSTKRSKLDEVHDHHTGMARRNKLFATVLPGSAQMLEGRTIAGLIGLFAFLFFVSVAALTGRLAPAIGPTAETAQLLVRVMAIAAAVLIWFLLSMPVYRRRVTI